jgi:hypothetical protein
MLGQMTSSHRSLIHRKILAANGMSQATLLAHLCCPVYSKYITIAIPWSQSEIMARDEVYDFAIANGEWLLHMMLASNYEAGQQLEPQHDTAQSAFISSEDLAKYGYTELPWDPVMGEGALDGLEPVFATIGANANMAKDGGKNVLADYKHTGACTINGIHYRVSPAHLQIRMY